jgi:ketosteroid isomerase-like protein
MAMGIKSLDMQTDEVELHGDTAIEISQATLFGEEKHIIDEIKYIVIWKRQDGQWKIHRDMFNSNRTIQQ